MVTTMDTPLGLIADSHGDNDLLLKAIRTVIDAGAHTIVHLGDICDSLAPNSAEDAVKILKEHAVRGVMGNNEYSIISEHHNEHVKNVSQEIHTYLSNLPYIMTMGPVWFTHSAPFKWPAATRRPIMDFLPHLLEHGGPPFEILFRGHSHRQSIIEIDGSEIKKIPVHAGSKQYLSRNRRYVITIGAVEEASSALFLPDEHAVLFLTIDRK